jgi:hypothetical protein
MSEVFISDLVQESIAAQAEALQAYYERESGVRYPLLELQKAVCDWLSLCLEELAGEALYHCAEADRSCAFNRSGWAMQLKKCNPAYTPEEADAA